MFTLFHPFGPLNIYTFSSYHLILLVDGNDIRPNPPARRMTNGGHPWLLLISAVGRCRGVGAVQTGNPEFSCSVPNPQWGSSWNEVFELDSICESCRLCPTPGVDSQCDGTLCSAFVGKKDIPLQKKALLRYKKEFPGETDKNRSCHCWVLYFRCIFNPLMGNPWHMFPEVRRGPLGNTGAECWPVLGYCEPEWAEGLQVPGTATAFPCCSLLPHYCGLCHLIMVF